MITITAVNGWQGKILAIARLTKACLVSLLFFVSSPGIAQTESEVQEVRRLVTTPPNDAIEIDRDIWKGSDCCASIFRMEQLRLESWVFAQLRKAESNEADPRSYRRAILEMLRIKGLRIGYYPVTGYQASNYRELIDEYFKFAAQLGREGDAVGQAMLYRQQIAYIRRWSEEIDADTEFEFLDKDDQIIASALRALAENLDERGKAAQADELRSEATLLQAKVDRQKLGPLMQTRERQRESGLWSSSVYSSEKIYEILRDLPETSEAEKTAALLELALDEFNSPTLRSIDLPVAGRPFSFNRGAAHSLYRASELLENSLGGEWPQAAVMQDFQDRIAAAGLTPVAQSVNAYLARGEVSLDAVRASFSRPGIKALNDYNRTLYRERGRCAPYGSGEINECWLGAQLKILNLLDEAGVMGTHVGKRELEEMAAAQQQVGNTAQSIALLERVYGPDFAGLEELGEIDGFLIAFGQTMLDGGKYAELERIVLRAQTLDPQAGALGNSDQRFLRSFNDWVSAVSTSARRRRNALLQEAYLAQPQKASLAYETAMELVAADRQRREAYGLTPWVEGSNQNDFRAAGVFFNAADAGWAKAQGLTQGNRPLRQSKVSGETKDLIEIAGGLLQDATLDPTGLALAYAMSERAAEIGDDETRALIRRRHALNAAWHNSRSQRMGELAGADAQIARQMLENEETDIAAEMVRITRQLQNRAPEYFAMIRPDAISTIELQSRLQDGEALLQIVPTAKGTHMLLVLKDDVVWYRADMSAREMSQPVLRLLWDLGVTVDVDAQTEQTWIDEGRGKGAYPYDRSSAFMLYQRLFEPLEDALEGVDTLYYAASGQIANLPLSALVTRQPKGLDGDPVDLRNTSWFADKLALAKVPSLQSWWFLRTYRKADGIGEQFIGFGDPVLRGEASERRAARGGSASSRRRSIASIYRAGEISPQDLSDLASLPGTGREIRALQTAMNAADDSVFLREAATEAAFKTASLSDANIIALATHGLLAGELYEGIEPGLVFTPSDSTDGNEGYLTASEIARLRLNAEWVILSACNTAAGDGSIGAAGLSGLARSFFYAGARSLLVSHWPVRDAVAEKMTVRAVEIARSNPGMNRARALNLAMREIRDNSNADSSSDTWAHPNAWAPFSLVGDALTN